MQDGEGDYSWAMAVVDCAEEIGFLGNWDAVSLLRCCGFALHCYDNWGFQGKLSLLDAA